MRAAGVVVLVLAGGAWAQPLVNRVASGDITSESAVLWARSTSTGEVVFNVALDPAFDQIVETLTVDAVEELLPVKVFVDDLSAGTTYYYRVTTPDETTDTGRFSTAHGPGVRAGLRFGVSGDWRGELNPYPAVKNLPGRDLDFFIELGDTIYADVPSPAVPKPQAETLEEFRLKHDEVYGERFGLNALGDVRASTSVLAMIDDHEVTNDFSGGAHPSTDPRFKDFDGEFINEHPLYVNGLQAFEEYNPIEPLVYSGTGEPRFDGKPDLYRFRTYGDDAAVITLDARSFRDEGLPPIEDPQDPEQIADYLIASFDPSRTMLGQAQLDRLLADLMSAHEAGVLWKFVVVPEPIQNLGVIAASDRFEGYAWERTQILRFVDENEIDNVVFIAADIHGTIVNDIRYRLEPLGEEISTGMLEVTTGSVAYDAPFGPTVALLLLNAGFITQDQYDAYLSLDRAGKDLFVRNVIDLQLFIVGFTLVGLEDAPHIDAELIEGEYVSLHTYGWTEFEIDAETGELLVSTYGIDPYSEDELLADPDSIVARAPEVVSRFSVQPAACPADFNGDGNVNVLDFVAFQLWWQAMDPKADCDTSGTFDVLDFVCFQGVFQAGCD